MKNRIADLKVVIVFITLFMLIVLFSYICTIESVEAKPLTKFPGHKIWVCKCVPEKDKNHVRRTSKTKRN